MIGAVVLAAGRSTRMGTQKLLLPFAGRTVIGHVVDQVLRSLVDRVVAVVGPDGDRITEATAGLPVTLVTNDDPEADMLRSVRCGLRALPPACDAAFIILGDQPGITFSLIDELVRTFRSGSRGIVVPTYRGKRGHPLLISTRYLVEVLTRYDGVGLRGLLLAHPDDVVELAVPAPAVLEDVDTPDDYHLALERFRERTGSESTTG